MTSLKEKAFQGQSPNAITLGVIEFGMKLHLQKRVFCVLNKDCCALGHTYIVKSLSTNLQQAFCVITVTEFVIHIFHGKCVAYQIYITFTLTFVAI